MKTIWFVNADGEQTGFLEENGDKHERDRVTFLDAIDDFECCRDETDENVDDRDDHDESETFVDHLNQSTNQRVIPTPFLQSDIQDPVGRINGRKLFRLI